MRSVIALVVLLTSIVFPGMAQNKERVNRVMTTATWVYVISDEGDEFSRKVSPEDRQAIENLRGALQKWGHYKVANTAQGADLLFVIHSEGNGGLIGESNRSMTRGDFGGTEDTLFVYEPRQYPNGGALWRAAMKSGLQSPRMPLFELLKQQVDEASKAQTKKP